MSVEAIQAFNEGVRAMRSGETEVAVQRWEAALASYPGMTPAARNLVVFFEEQEAHDRVAEVYGEMLRFDPYDTDSLIRQAAALRRLQREADAIQNYERAISIYPYCRWWYDELADLLASIERGAEADTWRSRAESLGADEAEMAFEDGVRHMREGNHALAATIFEAVLEELPANLEARLYAARSQDATGNHEAALEHFALALRYTDAAPARVHLERARYHLKRDDFQAALTDLEFACEHDPTYGRARALLDSVAPLVSESGSVPVLIMHDAPSFEPVDRAQPWVDQVAHVVRQALGVASRQGRPGRLAIFFERDASVAPLAAELIEVVTAREFGLYGKGSQRVFGVLGQDQASSNAGGIAWEGWLDEESVHYLNPSSWRAASGGIAIDRMLESASRAVGEDGFNLVLIVGTGLVRHDQTETVGLMRRLPCYQVVEVSQPNASKDLALRLQAIAPNWFSIDTD